MPRPPRSRCPRCSSASSPGWGGAYLLPNLIGIENALEVVIENPLKQNRTLKAQHAFDFGIVDAIFPRVNYLEDSLKWADGVLGGTVKVNRPNEPGKIERLAKWDVAIRIARGMLESRSARSRSPRTRRSTCSTRRRAARRPRGSPVRTRRSPTSSRATSSWPPSTRSTSCRSAPSARSAPRQGRSPKGHEGRHHRRRPHGQPVRAAVRAPAAGAGAHHRPRPGARRQGRRVHPRRDRQARGQGPHRRRRGATGCARSSPAPPTRPEYADCDFVIEAVFEEVGVKQQVFGEIEKIVAEDAILATNTSSLSVEEIGAKLAHPERLVGFHFFNPVAVMPLIEIVKTPQTTDAALSTAFVVAAKTRARTRCSPPDAPGFVVNRLLAKVMGEAARAVYEGTPVPRPSRRRSPRSGCRWARSSSSTWSAGRSPRTCRTRWSRAFPDRFYASENFHPLAELGGPVVEKDKHGKVTGWTKDARRCSSRREDPRRRGHDPPPREDGSPTRSSSCSTRASSRRSRTSTSASSSARAGRSRWRRRRPTSTGSAHPERVFGDTFHHPAIRGVGA